MGDWFSIYHLILGYILKEASERTDDGVQEEYEKIGRLSSAATILVRNRRLKFREFNPYPDPLDQPIVMKNFIGFRESFFEYLRDRHPEYMSIEVINLGNEYVDEVRKDLNYIGIDFSISHQ